ncbi:sensor histidine kinase [Evansella sp. AB-P1]|uniref:sensor histidine kinase n=1 Tax=Evansella sp. AB-P1 TaxID=3037653 RepID=UPI00241CC32C|nr:sensor histidine kinase [Evansella sp. AB-P1]MDG5788333.1 sensor histidine kinase [Evansella sp. AB-P1]
MRNWFQRFRKSTGLSPFVWIVFYILPFYFILYDSSTLEVVIGILMIIGYFISYVLSFTSKGWLVYIGASVQIAIATAMSLLFGYIYFFLFLAFFIGNVRRLAAFITFYTILLVSTFATSYYGFFAHDVFITQLPFVFLSILAVILLPVSTYNKNKKEKLQVELASANKRISELVKLEERQRISRDLHDTLGQKLSLIGLKSDLAAKLITKNPAQARTEIKDIQKTSRIALKEVRELVMEMRGARLKDEIFRVDQLLKAAQIDFHIDGEVATKNISLIAENVISMCIKEAINNVVKHSNATQCSILINQLESHLQVKVIDNGRGMKDSSTKQSGSGLQGMKERLEFVNGSVDIISDNGTTIVIEVPNNYIQQGEGANI